MNKQHVISVIGIPVDRFARRNVNPVKLETMIPNERAIVTDDSGHICVDRIPMTPDGAIENGEHGLFVALGSFSNDARTFERMKPNLRLIDGPALIDLIYAHYHNFEPRYQMLMPLKRHYIPSPISVLNNDMAGTGFS